MHEDIWMGKSVYITSFWGWSPETWGNVGFTDRGRRDSIIAATTDPFVMVIYVTKKSPIADNSIKGMITGYYIVTHEPGHRDEYTTPAHHIRNPEKWQYALKATRAFSFLPEYRISIDDFDFTIKERAQTVAKCGEEVKADLIDKLKEIPCIEVPIFKGTPLADTLIQYSSKTKNKVRAGPVNRSGYMVPGEPYETEKELYALTLKGDVNAYLGKDAEEREIYKIGLSMSPEVRLKAFQSFMPKGTYLWEIVRTTRTDGHNAYPSFEAAECGENAMKDYLGVHGEHLGGEFYAATPACFEHAWRKGREAALNFAQGE